MLRSTIAHRANLVVRASIVAAAGMVLAACGSSETDVAASVSDGAPAESRSAETSLTNAALDECAQENLTTITPGALTIGTDSPAYPPFFSEDDPSNGEGFESAVAYAIADQLGFAPAEVAWEIVPFSSALAPGKKNFDFDINQISITAERAEVVDFSDGYYAVNQAVVALADSSIASATTVAELKDATLGAQFGTTSLALIEEDIQPDTDAFVYDDFAEARAALRSGQIDGIVVDLPSASFITSGEIENSKIVGQFPENMGGSQFGLLFQKGNPLVGCVNKALGSLVASGELQNIQDTWLTGATVPYFSD
ncbi:MAG: ABC transporter substrate-binding protein [Candidatus Nanopelagicales bacterium]|nr:ABC transporter substrate-binding protein [Candidatus Nanopelagicales bacterium]